MSRARVLADYVSGGTTAAEFDYLDGVTSNVQTQLDAKSPTTGHASIATVGTVTSGTWQGTTVAVNQGGTGAATHTANNVMIGAGTSALTSIAPGADGQVLTSTGSVWQSEAAGGSTSGHVIQYDSATVNETVSSTSTSYEDFGTLSVSVTTAALNSVFFIHFYTGHSLSSGHHMILNIKRVISGGATTNEIGSGTYGLFKVDDMASWQPTSLSHQDSPSLAAGVTVTYTLRGKVDSGTSYWAHSSSQSSAFLFEIGV